jgi:hypothetical protein
VRFKYCSKGFALKETLPALFPITGIDAEVQGAVASFKANNKDWPRVSSGI